MISFLIGFLIWTTCVRLGRHQEVHSLPQSPPLLPAFDSDQQWNIFKFGSFESWVDDTSNMDKGINLLLSCIKQWAWSQRSKSRSDHDQLPDWVLNLNYVRSQALQPLSRSRTGSVHCEVIFCSYCADWPMHGFSAHFQNAHAQITFRKSVAFTRPQNQAF